MSPARKAGGTVAATILIVVEDLLFLSKIQQTASALGLAVRPMDLSKGTEARTDDLPQGIILDLNHRSISALELVRNLKKNAATRGIPIVGFVSHVQADLISAARAAGCDIVLARSAFTQQLPQLLDRLAGSAAARGGSHG
jgi:CheY-like chemotaxis protein